jgi:ParB-like chromosome segregation protein Spo0J
MRRVAMAKRTLSRVAKHRRERTSATRLLLARLKHQDIDIRDLEPNPLYAWSRLDDVADLRDQIRESRLIVPPLVVRNRKRSGKRYIVLDGHRRVAAAQMLGLSTVPCAILSTSLPPSMAFVRVQVGIAAEQASARQDWEMQQRRAMGLPPLTDAEFDELENTREEADEHERLADRGEMPLPADDDGGEEDEW